MKLYTEEQVRKLIELSRLVELYGTRDIRFRHTPNEIIEKLTPIELPSDEDLFKQAIKEMEEWYGSDCKVEIDAYFRGAKLMKKQIQGNNI